MSERRREVSQLILKGLSNAEIASKLFVAETTVKQHLTDIYRICGVKNRGSFIAKFLPTAALANADAEIERLKQHIESLEAVLGRKTYELLAERRLVSLPGGAK